MATAIAPATISSVWRSGSRNEIVARVKNSNPASNTRPTGNMALSCQLTRIVVRRNSSDAAPAGSVEGRADLVSDEMRLGISMHSRQKIGHSKECEHYNGESQDREVR